MFLFLLFLLCTETAVSNEIAASTETVASRVLTVPNESVADNPAYVEAPKMNGFEMSSNTNGMDATNGITATNALVTTNTTIHSLTQSPDTVQVFIADFTRHELRLKMESNASRLLSEINQAWNQERLLNLTTGNSTDEHLTQQAASELDAMWETAMFYMPDETIIQTILQQTDGHYEMRNIPLFFLNEEGEEIYEEGVLRFTPSGMISEVRIGLPMHQYQSLIRESQDEVDGENREMILSFVEAFRTAYNTKNLQFIENVFSDEALIIVGRVIESTGEESAFEQQVEYLQFNKDEYIARLETIFKANTWIDVGFEDISIDRHPRLDYIYGVYLTQYYTSSIYSDTGYLFLMIDFRVPEEPMIHVRTWEPKNQIPEGDRFQMGLIELF